MKRKITTFVVVLILLVGLSLLLYPTVSDYLQTLQHRRIISEYLTQVEELDDTSYQEVLQAAEAYNTELANGSESLVYLPKAKHERYNSLLNVSGNGVMGYIQIKSINVALPIYHGADETVLQVGVGHIEGSSLPVGGETAHCLLSGHRGLPSATLFTHLDRLAEGDIFTLRILREAYTYQIDRIEVVLPEELNTLKMEAGEDYCTLITCTPYGVNTHRLLVRGHRIETPPEEAELPPPAPPEKDLRFWIIGGAVAFVLLILVIFFICRKKKRADPEETKEEPTPPTDADEDKTVD